MTFINHFLSKTNCFFYKIDYDLPISDAPTMFFNKAGSIVPNCIIITFNPQTLIIISEVFTKENILNEYMDRFNDLLSEVYLQTIKNSSIISLRPSKQNNYDKPNGFILIPYSEYNYEKLSETINGLLNE